MAGVFHYRPLRPRHTLLFGALFGGLLLAMPALARIWPDLSRGPPALVFVLGSLAVSLLSFGLPVAGLAALARLGWAGAPIQEGAPPGPPLRRVLGWTAFNHLLVMPLLLVVTWWALDARGFRLDAFPTRGELLGQLGVLVLLTEGTFYVSHRLLHRTWAFRHIHRWHHELRAPSAITAFYMHPAEFALNNLGPLLLGVVVLAPPLLTLWVFAAVGTLNVTLTHSGRAIFGLPWAEHHDWHHHVIRENFGSLGLLDLLLGTDRGFRAQGAGGPVRVRAAERPRRSR